MLVQLKKFNNLSVNNISTPYDQNTILMNHSDLFNGYLGKLKNFKAKIILKESSPPIFFRPRPISFFKRQLVAEVLDKWEKQGVVKRVNQCDYATPIVAVLKKDNSVRVCADFSVTINRFISRDEYPLPKIEELLEKLSGGFIFSVIDLDSAYLQMKVEENSQKYLTINTHQGLYQFRRLPFGLSSAPAIWQRTIDQIIGNRKFVTCYLDDIIVSGTSFEDHLSRLNDVLNTLRNAGLKLKLSKCNFFKDEVSYCGMIISRKGVCISEEKVNALKKCLSRKTLMSYEVF